MAILNRVKRVDLGDGDWIELRPLDCGEAQSWQAEAQSKGEDEGYSYELLEKVRGRIVSWSDPEPPSPENTARLPIEINAVILHALMDVDELPLASGSPSTAISTVHLAE